MTEQKKGWDLGVVLALIAVMISICTMIISLVETSIMQKQQQAMTESAKASVWPYVTSLTTTGAADGETQFKIVVENKGVGPALINQMEVRYNDQPIDNSIVNMIRKHCPDALVTNFSSNVTQKMVLSPGEIKSIISIDLKEVDVMSFAQFTEKVSTHYCYSNIYGDIWISLDGTPIEINQCE